MTDWLNKTTIGLFFAALIGIVKLVFYFRKKKREETLAALKDFETLIGKVKTLEIDSVKLVTEVTRLKEELKDSKNENQELKKVIEEFKTKRVNQKP